MEYNVVKNASGILNSSKYYVSNPTKYKGKWNDFFGNHNPIYLELGTGRGEFIIQMAKKYPEYNFIGLELNESQIATAAKKLERENINNLKLIKDDARNIVSIFGKEIDTIYLTFSEPWPKKRDERNRFTHESYLKLYDRIYKKNKHIILKTDNKGLFAYSLETLSNYWYVFDTVSLDLHNDERNIPNLMTDFEIQYYKEKRPIYYLDASFKN
ncbi:MAG TPA: tRNA (guanosine(46)-N7)-methyltransferase TrmB [Candidatus Onthocola stercoravium]|nr:tRNA (guanosine(46)-N7)-methyltransferase TrmB [Candidatus Onthocola stercoravium]